MVHSEPADVAAMADVFTPLTLRVVATLGVADALRAGPLPIAELAERCGAQPELLARLLRFLCCRGVFEEVQPDVFAVNEPAGVLYDDHPMRLRGWLDIDGAVGRGELAVSHLLDTVRTGCSAYARTFGRTLWDDLAVNPPLSRSFDELMELKSDWSAPPIVAAHTWDDVTHVVDIGGGTGRLIREILSAHEHIRATLVELPGPAGAAARSLHDHGMADRCTVISGSFFDSLPAAGDLYVLSDILNALNDSEVALLMRRCAQAAQPAGRVLLVELIDTGDTDRRVFTEMDLRVLACAGGLMRTLDQIRNLTHSAGLKIINTRPTPIGYTLIECEISLRPTERG